MIAGMWVGPLNVAFLAALAIAEPAAFAKEDVLAYLRLPSILKSDQALECWVRVIDPSRDLAALEINDQASGRALLQFDPDHNQFIRFYPLDVTGDGVDELITFWTHGVVLQLAIFSLTPEVKLLFQMPFRHDVTFETKYVPHLKTILRIFSGDSNFGNITVENYVWSNEQGTFICESNEVIQRGR